MLEKIANIWGSDMDHICVTTNGILCKNETELVMGGGIALEAKQKYPKLPSILAERLKKFGNVPQLVLRYGVISFPTKHDWKDNSSLPLITVSAENLVKIIDSLCIIQPNIKVGLPRPGCGLGGLSWEEVKPALKTYLDSRFTIFHNQ